MRADRDYRGRPDRLKTKAAYVKRGNLSLEDSAILTGFLVGGFERAGKLFLLIYDCKQFCFNSCGSLFKQARSLKG